MPPTAADDIADRLADVYDLIGPLYRRAVRQLENDQRGPSVGVRAVLDLLRMRNDRTVPQIAETLAVSRQFVQRMVNEAADRAWVQAVPNPAHQRSSLIRLTADGRRVITGIRRREHDLLRDNSSDLTVDDVDHCLRVLRHLLATIG
jgi:DNA-binding MarR family transcriptional regulator